MDQETNISEESLQELRDRIRQQLSEKDFALVSALIDSVLALKIAYEQKKSTLSKLLKRMFGADSEKFRFLEEQQNGNGQTEQPLNENKNLPPEKENKTDKDKKKEKEKEKKPRNGGGHLSAKDLPGAEHHKIPLSPEQLDIKICPNCGEKIYPHRERTLLRFTASPPIKADIYHVATMLCRMCNHKIEAPLPAGVGDKTYDNSVSTQIGLFRFQWGVPHYRQEDIFRNYGVRIPVGTQYDLIKTGSELLSKVYEALEYESSTGNIIQSDDTWNRILDKSVPKDGRKGVYTTIIRSRMDDGPETILYYTGHSHQGENMGQLLKKNDNFQKKPVIHMADASSMSNIKIDPSEDEDFMIFVCRCLVHARRQFVQSMVGFREQSMFAIEKFAKIFIFEREAVAAGLNSQARLAFHQEKSAPLMKELFDWCKKSLDEKLVEPNCSLGKAMKYFLNHYEELCGFLKYESALLHNNDSERGIKASIRHRKNSLFYRNYNGAMVGDIWQSLIETCRENEIDPRHYINTLLDNEELVKDNPYKWLPWNYKQQL
jgi:transposase